ncbi:MAG: sarcosine oxidase subunit gamma family protein [Pseudomonadota bacterium]
MPDGTFPADLAIRRDDTAAMVTLKADLADPAVAAAVTQVTGAAMPGPLAVTRAGETAVVWMAPDELMILGPEGSAGATVAALEAALPSALALDMSDARTLFAIEGPAARDTLAKGVPVDLRPAVFTPGTARRTHMGQVAIGVWLDPEGGERFGLVCFRSLAAYVAEWLAEAGQPAGRVGHHRAG